MLCAIFLIMLQYAVIRRQGDDVRWFTQWFIYAVWNLYNMSVWIMFHRWNGRHGASPRGLKELSMRTWCKIPWLGYCIKPTSSTSFVWICGFAEKSLFVASTLRIIIITACLFTWQIYKKRGGRMFFKRLLIPHLLIWRPVLLWHCTSLTGNGEGCCPWIDASVLFKICLRPHLHLAIYRSKQGPNLLCLPSLLLIEMH